MLEKPIFVVGVGRSGSTVFHEMLSEHPAVSWLSSLCNDNPARPSLNRMLMRGIDVPILGSALKRRYIPDECYAFWEFFCRGFSVPCRDLLAEDVTHVNKRMVQEIMSEMVTRTRNRLLFKITGWPRIGFLREIFPEARFVHIYRDGRAVANSLLAVDFWWGWRGPENWRWGPLSPAHQQEWERHGKSFVALAAIQWKLLMAAMEKAKQGVPAGDLLEIRYEDLASRPVQTFKEVTRFCELEWSQGFEQALGSYTMETTNAKWKTDLTPAQQAILEAVLADTLTRYGYR